MPCLSGNAAKTDVPGLPRAVHRKERLWIHNFQFTFGLMTFQPLTV